MLAMLRLPPSWYREEPRHPAASNTRDSSCAALVFRITRFLLTSDCEDEYCVKFWNVSIQRDIPSRASTDDELSEIHSHGAAYERIAFQYVDRPNNVFDARFGVGDLLFDQVRKDAIEVVADLWSELDP
jgi:hypothetical protein